MGMILPNPMYALSFTWPFRKKSRY